MTLYLTKKRTNISATAEYDPAHGFTVLKGSVLSTEIAKSATFRGAKSIEKARTGVVANGVLEKDVTFKSASTAANFVTGCSTNGLIAWKDKDGRPLKDILAAMEDTK